MNASKTSAKPALRAVASSPEASPPVAGLTALIDQLNAAFPERGDVIRATLTAAVAGEHTVTLGPPGTAKSAITRSIKDAFSSSYFELLLTRFTTPEEVFGPVKLSGLQSDRFTRASAGYFPTAEVAFLDEIFKANSAILNALLAALNERVFHDDGKAQQIPLLTCIAASNELPEGPELDALYDRFLVRCVTSYIADTDNFRGLISGVANGTRAQVSAKVDIRAEQTAARNVVVTDETIDALVRLRGVCAKEGFSVSDRRWVQCINLVRAAAHIEGRTETQPDDLEVLEHVLWRKPDERFQVAKTIQTVVNPAGAEAVKLLDAARDLFKGLPDRASLDAGPYFAAIGSATKDASDILKKVSALPPSRKVNAAKDEITAIKTSIARLAAAAAGLPA